MHPFTECTDVSEFPDAGGGQRFDGRKRGVAEGTSDRYDFPAGKHGIFRRSQRRNQGGRHTVCAAFK